ncbi:hypothetical protein ACYUXM_004347, partial [Escherichia coli]
SSSASAAAQKASESSQSAAEAELSRKTAESAAGNAARDATYSAAIFLIPICISFDTDEKRR